MRTKQTIKERKEIIKLVFSKNSDVIIERHFVKILLEPDLKKRYKMFYGYGVKYYGSYSLETGMETVNRNCVVLSSYKRGPFRLILSRNISQILKKNSIKLDRVTARLLASINLCLKNKEEFKKYSQRVISRRRGI